MQNTHADKNTGRTSNASANQTETSTGKSLPAVPVLNRAVAQQKPNNNDTAPSQLKTENNTGMPDGLKSGIETLSGFSMDSVRVHYNSDKPKQLRALAYAQGTDIHIGPGQEKHLPHEAWHVVQQQQGRVQATTQLKGTPVNDDQGLESEADMMGAKAMQLKAAHDSGCCCNNCSPQSAPPAQLKSEGVVQRARFLSVSQATSLGEKILETMSNMEEAGQTALPAYTALEQAYNGFEPTSDINATIGSILAATAGSTSVHAQQLNAYVNNMLQTNAQNVRANNYPSAYNATANNARDNYQNGRINPLNTNQWQCPGNGGNRAAHYTTLDDITIDHINPCANQWNTTGYNTDRTARNTWYNDTSNHRYMCRACNSSLGSGGIVYRIDTGNNYSAH